MDSYSIETRISGDGSTTLYRVDLDEHYHSIHGAIQESEHVYIDAGLRAVHNSSIHVLEVGFGTGLNALLTLLRKGDSHICYHSIEKYPLPGHLIDTINYPSCFSSTDALNFFQLMHLAPWNVETAIAKGFLLTKLHVDLLDFRAENCYDLVYFDAFAPEKQPELWSRSVFEMLYAAMRKGGVLTTYCAKGSVRRTMMAAGFLVERLPGPPRKIHILRAVKPVD